MESYCLGVDDKKLRVHRAFALFFLLPQSFLKVWRWFRISSRCNIQHRIADQTPMHATSS